MAEPFLIFGHRGSPKRFPENTIASFDEALRSGADGFETDLRLLSDKTAVLYHDDDFADADVETLSAVEIAERGTVVQQLHDLAAYAERTTMILEVKRSKWEDVLLEHIAGWPNVVLASFDHSTIAEVARRNTGIPLGITVYGYLLDLATYASRLGATWCFPNFHYVDEALVASLHARGIKVVPWTANRTRDWERLREIGCDGVITDFPAEAVEWRGQSGQSPVVSRQWSG
ncbi:MAG TPA: glycerophosphodiester phosphodiesterase [Chloroflexia bacterium]|nr:glycerophosphodiester phosphodiesterase [Chloroflexia bacterium]